MPTFKADIREIRQTVYGRDMREPIADAVHKVGSEHPVYAKAAAAIAEKESHRVMDIYTDKIRGEGDKCVLVNDSGQKVNLIPRY